GWRPESPASRDGPPGGYGAWRLRTPAGGPGLIIALDPIATQPCDHRYQAEGRDPGVKLRHLTQVRYATCTGPGCRRPSARADFEHDTRVSRGSSSGAGEFLVLLQMVCELGFLLRLVPRALAPAARALAAGMPKSRAGKDGLPWCGSGCPSP